MEWGELGHGYLEIKKFSGMIKLSGLGAGLQVYYCKHDDFTSAFSSAFHNALIGTLGMITCAKCLGQRLTHRLRSPLMTSYYEETLLSHEFLRISSFRNVTKQRLKGKLPKTFKVSIGFYLSAGHLHSFSFLQFLAERNVVETQMLFEETNT